MFYRFLLLTVRQFMLLMKKSGFSLIISLFWQKINKSVTITGGEYDILYLYKNHNL